MTLLAHCLCGPRRAPTHVAVADARQSVRLSRLDPTDTLPLRRKFSNDMDRRWSSLRKLVVEAVSAHDILGVGGPTVSTILHKAHQVQNPRLPQSDKVIGFQNWIDEALRQVVGDKWVAGYIEQAWNAAEVRAAGLVGEATVKKDRLQSLISLTQTELQGVCEAVSQQAVRAATNGILLRQRPNKIAREIVGRINAIGKVRGRLIVQTMVVRTFSSATLDAFRARGIKQVGTKAERLRVAKGMHGLHLMKDAVLQDMPKGPGSRTKQSTPSASTIGRIENVQSSLEGLGEVDVLTAGDDDVCPECQDISDSGPYDIDEAESLIPAHPNCLPADSLVLARDGVLASSERWYAGQLVVIKTASGRFLSCTPNHPVLTDRGWLAANLIDVGNNVVSDGGCEWETSTTTSADNNYKNVPTRIHDVARSFLKSSQVRTAKVPTTSPDFHGDGMQGEVAVIRTNCELRHRPMPALLQHPHKFGFIFRNIILNIGLSFGSFEKMVYSLWSTTSGIVRRFKLLLSFACAHLFPLERFGFAGGSTFDSILVKNSSNDITANIHSIRDSFFRHAAFVETNNLFGVAAKNIGLGFISIAKYSFDGLSPDAILAHKIRNGETGPVFLDQVVCAVKVDFSGHVYNLQTPGGYYSAGGIITHNCRCAFVPTSDGRFAEVE